MQCNICKNEINFSFQVETKKSIRNYFHCNICNTIFLDKKHHISFEQEKIRYDLHSNAINDVHYRNYFKNFITYFSDLLTTESKILDFGSGPEAVLADVFKELHYTIDFYDIHYQKDEYYKQNKYDIILSTEVFEHLSNPIEIIENLITHLHPKGYLIIMTNFHENDEQLFKKWWYINDLTHITFYSIDSFIYLANKFRMKIERTNDKNIIILKKTY